jgi:hypothetical protein
MQTLLKKSVLQAGVFIAVFLILGVLYPAAALEYGGIGGRPGSPRPDEPRSESIFLHTVTPGQVIGESVLVINNTSERKDLVVYAADSTPSTDGAFACEQLSEPRDSTGAWIDFGAPEVQLTLEPKEKRFLPFQIVVPAELTPGEHNGCVLIQDLKKSKADGVTGGIHLAMRTGMRVLLTAPGAQFKELSLTSFTATALPDRMMRLVPEVRNDGNVSVEADVKVVTRNSFGQEVFTHGGLYTILPFDTSRWNFEFKAPFYGGWFTSSVRITYNDGTQDRAIEGTAITFFIWPPRNVIVAELAFLSVLLPILLHFIWGWLIFWLRRYRWPRYTVREGDDIMKISKQRHISWKLLIKINNIKPPYVLTPGEKIRVPPPGTHVHW